MKSLGERLDRCTLDRLERDHAVARIEHRRRREIDLLARGGLLERIDVGLADHRRRQLDTVDDEAGLVTRLEVDDDTLLLQHLHRVLDRLHRLDRLGPIDSVVAGERRGEPEDDQDQPASDREAGDQQATIESSPRSAARGGIGGGVGGAFGSVVVGIVDDGGVGVGHTIGHVIHDARPPPDLLSR